MCELLKKINKGIQLVTKVDPKTIDADKPIREQIVLDSMQFIGIIAALEETLNIEIPTDSMAIDTLNQFYDIILEIYKKERNA